MVYSIITISLDANVFDAEQIIEFHKIGRLPDPTRASSSDTPQPRFEFAIIKVEAEVKLRSLLF
jgi:hypothetical protein